MSTPNWKNRALAIVLALSVGPTWADVQCGERFVTFPGVLVHNDPEVDELIAQTTKPGPQNTVTIEKSSIVGIYTAKEGEAGQMVVHSTYRQGKGIVWRRDVKSWPMFRDDLIDCLD